MQLNRREFVILSAGLIVGGCLGENPEIKFAEVTVDAGPASEYAADGVYDKGKEDGYFVVRQGAKLFAISSICTHRHCMVSAQPDHSFHCKCHGSSFDPNGAVTHGPAIRSLPVLSSSVDSRNHLIIHELSV
jgi:Rieske Fe-S protein